MGNKKLKEAVGIVVAIVAITLVAYFGFLKGGAGSVKTPAPTTLVISEQPLDEAGPGYSIIGSYPVLQGGKESGAFNGYISSMVQSRIDDFKQSFGERDISRLPLEMQEVTSTLIINYSIEATSTDFMSVLLSSESYLVGMAHPSHAMDSVNFDLTTGKDLALGDFFAPGSDYLKIIADYAKSDILNQIKDGTYFSTEDYLDQSGGLLPDESNFQVFNVTPDALVVHFQEYQVGPYVSGPATTTIPWSIFKGVLNPVGPLNRLFH